MYREPARCLGKLTRHRPTLVAGILARLSEANGGWRTREDGLLSLYEVIRMRFVKESRIAAPPEVVFGFHESPGALRSLIPPWEKMEVAEASGSLQAGSKVVLKGHMGPLPIRWVAVHTEYDPPQLFADRQESGPFASWYHRHRFLDDGQGGTILRDEVDYQPPLGLLGRWLGGWLIRRKLERMFAYRHEITRRMIESGEWKKQPQESEQREA